MLEWLNHMDHSLLLLLNGSDSLFLDNFMYLVSGKFVWIPLYIFLALVVFRNNTRSRAVLLLGIVALTILLADQGASGICKPFFARLRPSHDPSIIDQVDIVNGYRGGTYGFMSSHASNTFALATLMAFVVRYKAMSCSLFFWAVLTCYSRIYLGVHFPGDVLCGGLYGFLVAFVMYRVFRFLSTRYMNSEVSISSNSTSAGYSLTDCKRVITILVLSYVIIGIASVAACFL